MDTQDFRMTKLDLFGAHEIRAKQTEAHIAVDNINEKWGNRVVALASTIGARSEFGNSLRGLTPELDGSPSLPSLGDVW